MRKPTVFRIMRVYLLVLVAFALGLYAPAYPSRQGVEFPRVLCSSSSVPGQTFQFSVCTQKLSYRAGEVANITLSFENSGSTAMWGREAIEIQIIGSRETALSDTLFCAVPEGCDLTPHKMIAWTFHWTTRDPGDYRVVAILLYIDICSTICRRVFIGPVTIGLTVHIAPR